MLRVVSRDPDQLVPIDASGPAVGSHGPQTCPLFGLDAAALAAVLKREGEPSWRATQIVEAIYHQYITELSSITTLPLDLRQKLAAKGWQIGRPEIAKAFQSTDGTERYLVDCHGPKPETVETVWMPEGDDGEAGDGQRTKNPPPKRNPGPEPPSASPRRSAAP